MRGVCGRLQEAEGSAGSGDSARIKDIISRCNAMASEKPKQTFSTKNLELDLPRLLKSGNLEQHRDVLDRSSASSALAGVATPLLCCLNGRDTKSKHTLLFLKDY